VSTRSEAVLSALADGATTRAEIAEATGLELQAVSQELSILRSKGLANRTPEGWVVTGTAGATEAVAESAPQKARRRKARKAKPAAQPARDTATPQVAVFGEFVVMRRADAERLLELHQALQRAGYGG
jgi:DNA-binding IclR family transcriptional regulator